MLAPTERIYRPGKPREGPTHTPTAQTAAKEQSPHPAEPSGADLDAEEKPFPIECLPPAAAAIAAEVARVDQVPASLPGCCSLGSISAAIGAALGVQSGQGRIARGNLYILASAESGTGKSEVFRRITRPLMDFERDTLADWQGGTKSKAEAEVAILESHIKVLTAQAGKAKEFERGGIRTRLEKAKTELQLAKRACITPALFCGDITSERLAVLLANNNEQLASMSADAVQIINNLLGRYSKLDRPDEGLYLSAFSGDSCRVDRQGREPVILRSPCLSALWFTQPDKLDALLKERSLTDGGLIPRLLACHTKAQPQFLTAEVKAIPQSVINDWAMLVGKLLRKFRLASGPFIIEPTRDARERMREYFNKIVARRLDDLRDVSSFAARWSEQAWRIAVCLHAGHHGEQAGDRALSVETAGNAIALADWFASEQLKILEAGRYATHAKLLQEVLALLVDSPKGITARDVYRKRIVPSAKEAHALLARLEADGEMQGHDSKPEGGGPVSRTFTRARR